MLGKNRVGASIGEGLLLERIRYFLFYFIIYLYPLSGLVDHRLYNECPYNTLWNELLTCVNVKRLEMGHDYLQIERLFNKSSPTTKNSILIESFLSAGLQSVSNQLQNASWLFTFNPISMNNYQKKCLRNSSIEVDSEQVLHSIKKTVNDSLVQLGARS